MISELDAYIILSVIFYSQPYPNEPKWYLDNQDIVLGSDIYHTTTFASVDMQLHRVTTYVDGFITNLTIKSWRKIFGDYNCNVDNFFGSSDITITLRGRKYSYISYTIVNNSICETCYFFRTKWKIIIECTELSMLWMRIVFTKRSSLHDFFHYPRP